MFKTKIYRHHMAHMGTFYWKFRKLIYSNGNNAILYDDINRLCIKYTTNGIKYARSRKTLTITI